jgi:hypothetical protein
MGWNSGWGAYKTPMTMNAVTQMIKKFGDNQEGSRIPSAASTLVFCRSP